MKPAGSHRDRSAIPVVAGVVDVLQAGGRGPSSPQPRGVVRLDDGFAAVREAAVAEQETEAAEAQVLAMRFGQAVGHERDADLVLAAPPSVAGDVNPGA